MPAAATFKTSSPGPGLGIGRDAGTKTSGAPLWLISMTLPFGKMFSPYHFAHPDNQVGIRIALIVCIHKENHGARHNEKDFDRIVAISDYFSGCLRSL